MHHSHSQLEPRVRNSFAACGSQAPTSFCYSELKTPHSVTTLFGDKDKVLYEDSFIFRNSCVSSLDFRIRAGGAHVNFIAGIYCRRLYVGGSLLYL